MRALSIEAPGSAVVVERAEPTLATGEVLVRVAYVGLCGTDLGTFTGKNPLVSYPRVIGHEISGTVVDVAPDVDRAWLQTRVAINPYKHCGECAACVIGRPNACRRNETLGVQRDGALADLVAVPVQRLVCSNRLSLDALALVEPFSIGMHAVVRTGVTAADTVLVLGCGGVGTGAIAAAASRGARVIGLDVDAGKRALAREFGASATVDATAADAARQITDLTGGEGPSVVIEAAGSPATYRFALEIVASGGRVGYIGWLKGDVPLEARLIVLKEVTIFGSRNATDELAAVVQIFEGGRVDPLRVVTDRVSLEAAPDAMTRWAAAPAGIGKILVAVD
jgi:threonine dehydrogenase-like Zn-dependent dehydrogenase